MARSIRDVERRKVRYLYLDARRIAKERGLIIYPPKKIFSARLAFYGGQFAAKNQKFLPYSDRVFERFWKQELDVESRDAISAIVAEVGLDPAEFLRYVDTDARADWMDASRRPIATRSSACRPSSSRASRSGARIESTG